jgi:hypothetical protein
MIPAVEAMLTMQAAIDRDRVLDQLLDSGVVGDVDREWLGYASGRADLPGDAFRRVGVPVGEYECGTFTCEPLGACFAEAGSCFCDDSDLAVDRHVSLLGMGWILARWSAGRLDDGEHAAGRVGEDRDGAVFDSGWRHEVRGAESDRP